MSGLRNDTARNRYEMEEQGHVSYADYRRDGDTLLIMYVFAPPELRGTGAAGRLMTAVAEEARREGWKITPICGYAASWLRGSKTYRDLVA